MRSIGAATLNLDMIHFAVTSEPIEQRSTSRWVSKQGRQIDALGRADAKSMLLGKLQVRKQQFAFFSRNGGANRAAFEDASQLSFTRRKCLSPSVLGVLARADVAP